MVQKHHQVKWVTGIIIQTLILIEQLGLILVYPKPYATAYNSTGTGTFPAIVGETGLGQSVLFEHEIGTDQINPDGTQQLYYLLYNHTILLYKQIKVLENIF